MTERESLIESIENLWPPDHSEQGKQDMLTALTYNWRELPESVLRDMLCLQVDRDRYGS